MSMELRELCHKLFPEVFSNLEFTQQSYCRVNCEGILFILCLFCEQL
jgi:hypothetical protein